ncbi:MAG: DinB family protein [Agriterribacter sp.]
MKVLNLATTFCFTFISCLGAWAQSSTDEMIKEWERARAYTKEYLDAMPAEKYALKPTPEMRSFAGQMLHLTDANYGFASTISGEKTSYEMGHFEKSGSVQKDSVTAAVLGGYDFVISTLKKISPDQLKDSVKLFGRFDMTKGTAFEKLFEHQTHHRGQATVYLRLAGVKPPQEKLF